MNVNRKGSAVVPKVRVYRVGSDDRARRAAAATLITCRFLLWRSWCGRTHFGLANYFVLALILGAVVFGAIAPLCAVICTALVPLAFIASLLWKMRRSDVWAVAGPHRAAFCLTGDGGDGSLTVYFLAAARSGAEGGGGAALIKGFQAAHPGVVIRLKARKGLVEWYLKCGFLPEEGRAASLFRARWLIYDPSAA